MFSLFPGATAGENSVLWFLFGFAILFFALAILREILTWYWKINKIVSLLEDIKKNTQSQRSNSVNNSEIKAV